MSKLYHRLENKYTTWYERLIARARHDRRLQEYTEKHHVLPTSLGGADDVVVLTAREHLICHLLLTKMYDGEARYKMQWALHLMQQKSEVYHPDRVTGTSRIYEYARQAVRPNRYDLLGCGFQQAEFEVLRDDCGASCRLRPLGGFMKFGITKEWLARKLAQADDTAAGAGGTDLERLKKETEGRTVTLTVFAETRSELGKVVRFIREQRGWSRQELADIAMINADDVAAIETQADYSLPPRAVYLADALGLSRIRLQELVGHVRRDTSASNDMELRFAANPKVLDRELATASIKST